MSKGGARPGSGRRRKDPALKALTGNSRPDRDNQVGVPAAVGSMICPLHLGDLEQLYFGRIAGILLGQDRASPDYSEHVALLATRLAQIERYQAVIACEGDTFTTESAKVVGKGEAARVVITTMIRAHPAVAMLSDAMRHAQSLLGELMLNPAAALRITSGNKPTANPFADLEG